MPKQNKAEDIPLVSFNVFKKGARKVFANTKKESDRQLSDFQASNARRRKVKKRH